MSRVRAPFSLKPIVEQICNMLRVWLCLCVAPVVMGIIVTEYPPTSTEYNYLYNIEDPSTGDSKSLYELRQGDTVTGSYSVLDPDGIMRTVKYTAGPRIGFKAVVRKEPVEPHATTRSLHNIGHRHAPAFFGPVAPIPYLPKLSKLIPRPRPSYLPSKSNVNQYFTPGNSTHSDKPIFKQGQFFAPNPNYHINKINDYKY